LDESHNLLRRNLDRCASLLQCFGNALGDGTSYTADAAFGAGTEISSGEFVVYIGPGTSETVASLTNGTAYCLKAFTRNGTDWSSGSEISASPTAISSPTAGVVFISEVSDAAADFNAEFLEFYNSSASIVDLSNAKLIRASSTDNSSEYVFDFGVDGSGGTQIPAYGFLIISRGATSAEFVTEWGALPAGVNYNEGNTNLFFGTGRRWRLNEGGTANTDDGTEIDDTEAGVATSSDRDYQNLATGDFVNATRASATLGTFDYGVYDNGTWTTAPTGATTADDFVVLRGTPNISFDVSVNSMFVGTNGTLTVDPGASITIADELNNSGTVRLDADATGYAQLLIGSVGSPGTHNGDPIAIEQYMADDAVGGGGAKWTHFVMPVAGDVSGLSFSPAASVIWSGSSTAGQNAYFWDEQAED